MARKEIKIYTCCRRIKIVTKLRLNKISKYALLLLIILQVEQNKGPILDPKPDCNRKNSLTKKKSPFRELLNGMKIVFGHALS